jgi:hypothetical protein
MIESNEGGEQGTMKVKSTKIIMVRLEVKKRL